MFKHLAALAAATLLTAAPALADTMPMHHDGMMRREGMERRDGAMRGGMAHQYRSESAARMHCMGGAVVWVNTNSGAVHRKGDRYYGRTKHGAYSCERAGGGMRGMRGGR